MKLGDGGISLDRPVSDCYRHLTAFLASTQMTSSNPDFLKNWRRLRTAVRAVASVVDANPEVLATVRPLVEGSLELLAKSPSPDAIDEIEYNVQRAEQFVARWRPSGRHTPGIMYNHPSFARDTDRECAEALRLIQELRQAAANSETRENSYEAEMNTTTGTRSILFMDVSGWSKLNTIDIKRYVETALPRIKPLLAGVDFLNTWGDAIVATFTSAKLAAEVALKIRDFFTRATQEDGVPEGLVCRISLHQGEILLCRNALTNTNDIFGHAVHVAARLEPATAPRHVFCTDTFARALLDVGGLGPKAWNLGTVLLPKKFGEIVASVVTWANEADPTAQLQEYVARASDKKGAASP